MGHTPHPARRACRPDRRGPAPVGAHRDRPPEGSGGGTPEDFVGAGDLRRYPTATFDELARQPDAVVLDVRRIDERADQYVPGSIHISLHSLLSRLDELPDGKLWVHCASGYRASIAAGLIDRAGREVVLIADSFDHAKELAAGGPP